MLLNSGLEGKLKVEALAALKKGNPWDTPHTLDSVRWMRKLIKGEGGDEKILVSTMYLHDIGYPESDNNYAYLDDLMNNKESHAECGARLAEEILRKLDEYDDEEIEEIASLIRNHDKHDNLDTHNRKLVFEADGLAQINWQEVKPSFNKEDCQRFLSEYFEKERPEERWHTEAGRKYRKELIDKAYKYLENI